MHRRAPGAGREAAPICDAHAGGGYPVQYLRVTCPRRRGQTSLLRRNPQLRLLLCARVVSFAGDQLTAVALTLHVHARYGFGSAVSVLLVALVAPQLGGPIAGAVVDRFDHRAVLRVCEVGRALVVTVIALTLPPLPVLAGLVAVNAVLATTLRPAGRSALPALVGPGDLGRANAAVATGANLGLALGPLVGGLLTSLVGVAGALFVDAATSLGSAIALRWLRPLPPTRVDRRATFAAEVGEGLQFTWSNRTTRIVGLTLLLGVSLAGTILVAGVFLVRDVLNASAAGYGAFSGAWGFGMIGVSLLLAASRFGSSPRVWLPLAVAAQAAGLLIAGVAPVLAVAVFAATIGGVGNGLQDIATDTVLQQVVPPHLLGRVVGTVYAASFAGELVAYAAAGPLVDTFGPRRLLVVAGGAMVLVTAMAVVGLRQRAATVHAQQS